MNKLMKNMKFLEVTPQTRVFRCQQIFVGWLPTETAIVAILAVAVLACTGGCSDMRGKASNRQELAPPSTGAIGQSDSDASGTEKEDDNDHDMIAEDSETKVIEAVALTVNDTTVTASQIFLPIRNQLRQLALESENEQDFMARAGRLISIEISKQVGQILISQEAENRLSEPEINWLDQEVSNHIRKLILRAGGSQVKLESDLAKDGTTLEKLRQSVRRDILGHFYLRRKLMPQLTFSRSRMLRYFNEHADEYSTEPAVRMRLMAFPYKAYTSKDGDAEKDAMAAAITARKKVHDGEDFEAVIKADSASGAYKAADGGLWDMMPAGSFREKAVEDVAFRQAVGQISDPIKGETGVFIVQTVESQSGGVIDFEQAQPDILEKLKQERYSLKAEELYSKLQQQADIRHSKAFDHYALQLAMQMYFNKESRQ